MTSTEHSTRADMLAHMGSLQQSAYVRPIEYQEGRAHGLKAIEVKNGPLRFVSMADRALDVCQFEYRGENLVLRRTITSVYGRPSITVEDEVTNESFRDEPPRKRVPARARRRRERPQLRRRGQPQARAWRGHRLRRQPLPVFHGMEVDGGGRLRGRPRALELQRPRARRNLRRL